MFVIAFHEEPEPQNPASLEKEIRRLLSGFRLDHESVVRESLDELRTVKISTSLFVAEKNTFLVAFMFREDFQSKGAGEIVKKL